MQADIEPTIAFDIDDFQSSAGLHAIDCSIERGAVTDFANRLERRGEIGAITRQTGRERAWTWLPQWRFGIDPEVMIKSPTQKMAAHHGDVRETPRILNLRERGLRGLHVARVILTLALRRAE